MKRKDIEINKDRNDFLKKISKCLRLNIKFGPALSEPVVALADFSKPGRIKVKLFKDGFIGASGIPVTTSQRQAICQRRVILKAKIKNEKRRLLIETDLDKDFTFFQGSLIQTIIIKSDELNHKKELRRLF